MTNTDIESAAETQAEGAFPKEILRVMLVDEDRKVHVLFDHLFRNSGIRIDHAINAAEALPRVHRGYGLVVTDLHMPAMSGIELLKLIKQIDASVEVIVISSDKSETAISQAMRHGAIAYLTKPFKTRDTVSRAVRRALDRWRETKKEEALYQSLISGRTTAVEVGDRTHHIPFVDRDFPVLELLTLLNDGFVFLNEEGRITFANVKFSRKLSWPYRAVFDKFFVKYVLRHDRDRFLTFLSQIRREQRTGLTEMRIVNRHGQIMHMTITCHPLIISDEKTTQMVLVVTDVSEQREAQERARHLATLVDRARFEAILVHEETNEILYCNRAAEEMFGYPEGGLAGVGLDKLFEVAKPDCRISLLPSRPGDSVVELMGIDLTGKRFPVEISKSADIDIEGGRAHRMIFARDISRRKRAEDELLDANDRLKRINAELVELRKAQSQFFANMSHELKTPLNTIGGYASLMLEEVGGPITEKQAEWLLSVKKQSGHLLSLIQEILDHARLEGHQSAFALRATDPRGIVEDVWSAAIALAKDKAVQVRMEIASEVGIIKTDGNRLRQILMNLVGNAVKFTEEGTVTISVTATADSSVAFEVRDDGCGISKEALPKIFNEFYQADGSTTRSHRGTGLGLAIVKRMLDRLDGRIEVQSELGVGSTFTVVLPAEPDPEARATPEGN